MRFFAFLFVLFVAAHQPLWADDYQVLCYHNVVPPNERLSEPDDINVRVLADHFDWLRANGYNVISLQNLIDARAGIRKLPEKAVLLSFDDAYHSFYTQAFPLLKAHGYPATLAVVGAWLEADKQVPYGGRLLDREHFMTVEQLKEVAASGLIEIASHTYDLHHGVLGNPQGNEMPAATALVYDPKTSSYESERTRQSRLIADFVRNSDFIEESTGKRPRVMVWPYGRYNGEVQQIADKLGMSITMTLDEGPNRLEDGLSAIHRQYLKSGPSAAALSWILAPQNPPPMRVMHVDLDYIHDPNPVQQEANLGLLLERIKTAGATTVFLQAYADEEGAGVARALYFPNRHLPMRADLFSRASWQISTRTGARVFAWLPLTAFVPPAGHPLNDFLVSAADGSAGIGYRRLSSFSPQAREYIAEIYEDLGRHAFFNGLLIHDDATLSDQEDASRSALDHYAARLGLPRDIAAIRADPELMQRWTHAKTEHLSWFSNELRRRVEHFRKPLLLARNYYAEPILNPDAEAWFAQSLPDALKHFDWVAIMAMPYMEKASDPEAWLSHLVEVVRRTEGADKKVIFELQAKRWSPDEAIPSSEIAGWMHQLRRDGIRNFGYYPDDPFANHPDVGLIRKELSTERFAK